ncbi:hypothetical protein CRUP_005561, partial [Coryphaenoides rupestris]
MMDRERDIDIDTATTTTGTTATGSPIALSGAAAAAVRAMKRGDPAAEADVQTSATAAALADLAAAECKRPRIDGTGDVGQNNEPLNPGLHGYPPQSQDSTAAAADGLVATPFSAFPPSRSPPQRRGG